MPDSMRLAVFVGAKGRGSNLRAVYAATQIGRLSAQIVLVIGSKADAPALAFAREVGLPVAVIRPQALGDEYADALLSALRDVRTDVIALAGYLRRIPSPVLAAFPHRVVNIHPSLLPAFGGQGMYGHHVHEAVLAYGAKVSGCTAHLVDETYDTGPVIVQRVVAVEESDTPETLAARILPCEHAALVDALQLLAENRVRVEGRRVHLAPPAA